MPHRSARRTVPGRTVPGRTASGRTVPRGAAAIAAAVAGYAAAVAQTPAAWAATSQARRPFYEIDQPEVAVVLAGLLLVLFCLFAAILWRGVGRVEWQGHFGGFGGGLSGFQMGATTLLLVALLVGIPLLGTLVATERGEACRGHTAVGEQREGGVPVSAAEPLPALPAIADVPRAASSDCRSSRLTKGCSRVSHPVGDAGIGSRGA